MKYEIEAYYRVGPFEKGMTIKEVEAIVGSSADQVDAFELDKSMKQVKIEGAVNCYFPYSTFYFVNDYLLECAFAAHKSNQLYYSGLLLDWKGKFIKKLCVIDGNPKEDLGFIELPSLGISLADFKEKGAESVIRVYLDRNNYEQQC